MLLVLLVMAMALEVSAVVTSMPNPTILPRVVEMEPVTISEVETSGTTPLQASTIAGKLVAQVVERLVEATINGVLLPQESGKASFVAFHCFALARWLARMSFD
jgi:hypothetical protein